MCGIIGGSWESSVIDLTDNLEASLISLKHRGPDDSGIEFYTSGNNKIALGHTRLSIIDLSAAGHQPVHSACGRYTLVFNGEIYNYRELKEKLIERGYSFESETDTEVLLYAWVEWGEESLRQLKGMFAFVIYDSTDNEFVCVRDAFGIKPFFYTLDKHKFIFSSEIPALLKVLPEQASLNLKTAYDYLVLDQYDCKEDSFINGVKHLLPGYILRVDLKDCSSELEKWWSPSIEERKDCSFEEAAIELKDLFLDNVRLHLRSDVPLGVALSGGLDSSAVACAVRELQSEININTFSYIAKGSDSDEEYWVDLINKYIKANPHKIEADPKELGEDLDFLISLQGEPFGSTSIYAQNRVFKRAKENGTIVVLEGQGADELLAGYDGYPVYRMRSLFDDKAFFEILKFVQAWGNWPNRNRLKLWLKFFASFLPNTLRDFLISKLVKSHLPSWLVLDKEDRERLGPVSFQNDYHGGAKGRRLMAQLRMVLTSQGLSALLRHADRNSMSWSLESRVPFLTIEMAEFLLSMPEEFLISPTGETKSLFREAMRGIVPDEVLDRKDKIGFETPELEWLKANRSNVMNWIEAAKDISFLDLESIQAEVTDTLNGQKSFSYQIWRIINYCRWVNALNV